MPPIDHHDTTSGSKSATWRSITPRLCRSIERHSRTGRGGKPWSRQYQRSSRWMSVNSGRPGSPDAIHGQHAHLVAARLEVPDGALPYGLVAAAEVLGREAVADRQDAHWASIRTGSAPLRCVPVGPLQLLRRIWTRGVISLGYFRGPLLHVRAAQAVGDAPEPARGHPLRGPRLPRPGVQPPHAARAARSSSARAWISGADSARRWARRAHRRSAPGSYLTYDVIITCDTSIEIGERCGLRAEHLHRRREPPVPRPRRARFSTQGYDYRPIRIEDDVQIHSKCTIVNSIGTRSVIGANAVVTRPIPPYCMAAGVPARVIDYFGPPGQEPEGLEPARSPPPTPRTEPAPSALAAIHSALRGASRLVPASRKWARAPGGSRVARSSRRAGRATGPTPGRSARAACRGDRRRDSQRRR